MELLEKDD